MNLLTAITTIFFGLATLPILYLILEVASIAGSLPR